MRSSDHKVSKFYEIYASHTVMYGKDKYGYPYCKNVDDLVGVIERVLRVICPILGVPKLRVVICPIKEKGVIGMFRTLGDIHWIEIDPRLSKCFMWNHGATSGLHNFIITLCHELVHWNQSYEKRLTYTEDGYACWNGVLTDGKYRDLPWEVEARGKQFKLACQYFDSPIGQIDRWCVKD